MTTDLERTFDFKLEETTLTSDIGPIIKKEDIKKIYNFLPPVPSYIGRTKDNLQMAEHHGFGLGKNGASDLSYLRFRFFTTKSKIIIERRYFTLVDVFSSVGGLLGFLSMSIAFMYRYYNNFKMLQYVILNVIIGRESLYSEKYNLTKDYLRISCLNRKKKSYC